MSESKRASAPARIVAAAAVIGGFLVVLVVISSSLGGDGGGGDAGAPAATRTAKEGAQKPRRTPQAYVVQNGDTLTSIARETGVSVARIQQLNPGVDPQILVSGEKLKLR